MTPARKDRSSWDAAARGASKHQSVVGWREWVSLPDLGLPYLKAKLDTGARTSALHAYDIKRFRRGGRRMARFRVHPIQRQTRTIVEAEAEIVDRRAVRSSSGHLSERIVVVTTLEIVGRRWPIELTLTNRDAMGFRLLLGRQALRPRILVDPGRSLTGGKPDRAVLEAL